MATDGTKRPEDDDLEYNYPEIEARPHTLTYMVPAPPRCCYKFKVGRMYVVSSKKIITDGDTKIKILCMLGACWPMTFVTMAIIGGLSIFVLSGFLPKLGLVWTLGAFVLLGSNLAALALTGTTDPGIVRRKNGDLELQDVKARRWSASGQTWVRKGESFCEESQVVVEDMDHFCPWTGTVIAGGNMIYFQVFIASLCTLLGFVALTCFVAVSNETRRPYH
ncbi:hypothetical protein AAMO2058_000353600 [Amorphochlora amoebiformis]